MLPLREIVAICSLCLVAAAGCGKSPAANNPSPAGAAAQTAAGKAALGASPAVSPIASLHQGEPITDAEALSVGKRVEAAVQSGDVEAFGAEFDWGAFGELVLADIPANSKQARNFRAGVGRGMDRSLPTISQQLVGQWALGSYVLLGVQDKPDGKRLLFRLQAADGGLNYHEHCLARRGGAVRAVDIYILMSGERLAESMQRMLLTAMPPDQLDVLARLSGKHKEFLKHATTFKQMTDAMKAGENQQAMELYQKLPPILQENKMVQVLRVMAAARLEDAEYLQAIDEYRRLFPGDASIDLISIDSYLMRKQWLDAHQAIDRLDAAVGGDPYLQFIHGNLHVQEGDLEAARTRAETLLQRDTLDQDAHWLLISISLARKDHAQTAKYLAKMRDELKVELGDLTQVPDYAEFIRSPEYAEFKKSILK